ncbi:alpha/beta hydrolase [Ruminococcus sp.]|uniref:alpha/beta hydrolase n=1 Tax=Ruminococcus sp. TaxID=41978 RepID=UPI0025D8DB0A|nr:alpha/beta hydrolase [Ruminococcus sp.]MBQ8965497.1 alpha/beta hydrolase [Ruminococcus sp.]
MKYFEFGKENDITLLLLHGVDTTWQLSFEKFIEAAKSRYHIIAVAEDGFNTDEPETDAVSVIAEAHKITEYLVENFDGKIDIILGESLGGMIMTEILLDPRISVHTAIADGFTILEYPPFRHDLPKRLFASAITAVEFFAFRHMGLFNKLLGEDIDDMIFREASKATLWNLEYSMMPYRYKLEAFDLADTYLWHGENEPGMKHVLRKVDRTKYHFKHLVFKGKGHGSLLRCPERMIREIDRAYKGYDKDYVTRL